jgi:hypothetical protein
MEVCPTEIFDANRVIQILLDRADVPDTSLNTEDESQYFKTAVNMYLKTLEKSRFFGPDIFKRRLFAVKHSGASRIISQDILGVYIFIFHVIFVNCFSCRLKVTSLLLTKHKETRDVGLT